MQEKTAHSLMEDERPQVELKHQRNIPSAGLFARDAARLIDNGYSAIPVWPGGKEASCTAWNQFAFQLPSRRHLTRWERSRADHSIGIVAGRVIGIDIDVLDQDKAARLFGLAIGHCGATPLIRIGRAPKRILVYRAKGIIPSRSVALECGNIDVIGESRQFVAYGIHPDTKQPYRWDEGESDPLHKPVDSLPELDLWQIEVFLRAAEMHFPVPKVGGRKGHGSESGEIVRHLSTGRVIDGRDTYLRDLVLKHCSNPRRRSVDTIVHDVWDEFCQTVDTNRPRSATNKPWSIKDARRKVVYAQKRLQEGKTRCASRVQRPPRHAPAIKAGGVEAFRRFIADKAEAGELSRAAGKVSAFMLSELIEGQCVHSAGYIAKATGLAVVTVKKERRRLVEEALWERAAQLGRHHTAPYWPSTPAVLQALEKYDQSQGRVYTHIPIPLVRDPLCSPEMLSRQVNDNDVRPTLVVRAVILDHQVQGDLLPFMSDVPLTRWTPPASVSTYKGGIIPGEIWEAILERKRAVAMRQEDIAEAIGISRPQLANAMQGRSGLSPEAAARLVQWLTAPIPKPKGRHRAA
jgi:hypothetical protein